MSGKEVADRGGVVFRTLPGAGGAETVAGVWAGEPVVAVDVVAALTGVLNGTKSTSWCGDLSKHG